MKITYVVDDKGNLIPAKLLKREAKGWAGTFKTAIKECAGSGKQFFKECDQTVTQFGKELSGMKKKK